MVKFTGLCFILFCSLVAHAQFRTDTITIYSTSVGDTFAIYVSVPIGLSDSKLNVVYYLDANIRSGNTLRKMISSPQFEGKLKSCVFIGIGHLYKGNHNVPRERDFIFETSKRTNTGKASRFLNFLKGELMPMIKKRFTGHKLANSIIGHSLGGLFVFYCLLKEPDLFSDYYALSPALWVHHGGIYNLNKYPSGYEQPRYLFFSAGSLEIFNRILFGAQKAARYFEGAKPRNFSWQFQVIKGKRHHTQVPSSLQLVFLRLRS